MSSALDALAWRDVRDGLWTFESPTAVLMHQHARPAHLPATTRVRLSEVVAALTCALDITEGQPEGTPRAPASSACDWVGCSSCRTGI